MKRILGFLVFAALAGGIVFWWLTAPGQVDRTEFDALSGDAENGHLVFAAGGCASCHIAPGTEPSEHPVLAGGLGLESPFGTFIAPNVSSTKMASWSNADLANALIHGTSPKGQHYFPAFPYASYRNIAPQDVADLLAYMKTLPASEVADKPHEIGFPFNIRRSLGGWKLLFLRNDWVQEPAIDGNTRGRYLVEALGHCAECHTPRNLLGGLERSKWLSGAPHPSGKGRIPSLLPADLGWSEQDIAAYLESGFTPDFDSAGGEMAEVVENMKQLPASDREAIAKYLVSFAP